MTATPGQAATVTGSQGRPYPSGWQPSLGRIHDADNEAEAIMEAGMVARAAPRAMGPEYDEALIRTLATRLGVPL